MTHEEFSGYSSDLSEWFCRNMWRAFYKSITQMLPSLEGAKFKHLNTAQAQAEVGMGDGPTTSNVKITKPIDIHIVCSIDRKYYDVQLNVVKVGENWRLVGSVGPIWKYEK